MTRITLTKRLIPATTDNNGEGGYPATIPGPVHADLVRAFDHHRIGAYVTDTDGEGYTVMTTWDCALGYASPEAPSEADADRVTVRYPDVVPG